MSCPTPVHARLCPSILCASLARALTSTEARISTLVYIVTVAAMKVIEESNVVYEQTVPKHVVVKLKACADPAICVQSGSIIAANKAWQDQCGFGKEAIGQSPKILHGERTDHVKAKRFSIECAEKDESKMTLINYKKDGTPFAHKIRCEKIQGSSIYLTQSVALPDSPIRRAVMKDVAIPSLDLDGLSSAKQLVYVTMSITLSVLAIIALSIDLGGVGSFAHAVSVSAVSTVAASASTTADATMATMFLLSLLVAVTKEATSSEKPSMMATKDGPWSFESMNDTSVAMALIVAINCVILDGAIPIPAMPAVHASSVERAHRTSPCSVRAWSCSGGKARALRAERGDRLVLGGRY